MRGSRVRWPASAVPQLTTIASRAASSDGDLSLVVDARTFQVLDFGLGPNPPPVQPARLGPVTYLTGRPR